MYDIYRNLAPDYLCRTFQCNRTRYATRSGRNSYVIPRTKITAQFNFEVIGAEEWNNLPPNIKLLESKDSFKKAVRAYLKTQAHAAENSDYVYY